MVIQASEVNPSDTKDFGATSDTNEGAPCIKCLQYRGGVSTMGDVEYLRRYHKYRGGYLEYHGGAQYCGEYMSTVGVILSTVEGVQYRGGIFCYLSTPRY